MIRKRNRFDKHSSPYQHTTIGNTTRRKRTKARRTLGRISIRLLKARLDTGAIKETPAISRAKVGHCRTVFGPSVGRPYCNILLVTFANVRVGGLGKEGGDGSAEEDD